MIREATMLDVPELLKMAERFIGDAWARVNVPFDSGTCQELIASLIDSETGFVLTNDQVECMMGVHVHPWHFNRNVLTSTELFWWSEPKCREAMNMIGVAEVMVSDRGARTFNMGAQVQMRGAALGRLYERRGYALSETIYIKELG